MDVTEKTVKNVQREREKVRIANGEEKTRTARKSDATVVSSSVPVMTGTHFHALDEKGRVIIPAKLRAGLAEQFWMMLDENDNVAIYNYKTGLDVLEHCEQMIAANPDDDDLASAVERITGAAELMPVDGNWRVQVPEILRFYSELDKEVVTVGVLNHAVMWSRDRWEKAQMRRLQSVEVRRAQAGLLRAAASSVKRAKESVEEVEVVTPDVETEVAAEIGIATGTRGRERGGDRVLDVGGNAGGSRSAAASNAPARDGGRGSRVLTLSRLGR